MLFDPLVVPDPHEWLEQKLGPLASFEIVAVNPPLEPPSESVEPAVVITGAIVPCTPFKPLCGLHGGRACATWPRCPGIPRDAGDWGRPGALP